MRRWAIGLCVVLSAAGGCDDSETAAVDAAADAMVQVDGGDAPPAADGEPTDSGPDAGVPGEGLGLTVRPAERELRLTYDGALRLRFPPDGLQIGVVAALEARINYDPWYVFSDAPGALPDGLMWRSAETWTARPAEGAAVSVVLDFGDLGAGGLRVEVVDGERVAAHFTPPPGAPVAYLRLRPEADATEGFYGLGEVFDDPNHRGRVRAMQLELDSGIESVNNEAHVPVPLLIGTTGWGLFVQSDHPSAFAVAVEDDRRIDAIVGAGLDAAEGLDFHLFAAAHPLDITRFYYDVAGDPRLPAPWALGPWVWRDENDDQAQVIADLNAMRDLDLPANGIWVDRPYASGVSSFDFSPAQFPDPAAMIETAHALGFRFALWHTAYVGEDQPSTAAFHAEAEAEGYYPPTSGAIVNDWGRPVDLTNPAAYAWWQGLIRRYTDLGVEGFKLDYVEDIVLGLFRRRNEWVFADGRTERTMHKAYQRLYHQVFAETLPEEGGFLLCRAGTWGGQTNGVIIWPGDLDADFSRHREPRTDGDGDAYVAVGGLPASMVAGLSLGPSGYPFYGADTGGYRHCPPDKETFARWFEQTALSSVMQIGTSCNDVAWEPTARNGFDAELLDWYRRYTRLHLRLWPYAWSLARRLAEDGRPLQRPYGLQHPELGRHPWDTYFFGDDLLVAPVVSRGERTRTVPFPPGDWFDWWTAGRIEGGADREVSAPLDTLPLFLRAGGVVPLLRPTIDSLAPTNDGARVDSYATTPGRLYAVMALGAPGGFTLFDGTRLGHDGAANIEVMQGEVFTLGTQLEIWGLEAAPAEVQLDGAPLAAVADEMALDAAEAGWWFDAARRALHLRLAPGDHAVMFTR
ncbi:MAG: glycoside hydrolase family 31 protein, partial [Myxococcales bacterium]|nr:glycoside hydrolase family 31 protein [Myxococcales bacterium]